MTGFGVLPSSVVITNPVLGKYVARALATYAKRSLDAGEAVPADAAELMNALHEWSQVHSVQVDVQSLTPSEAEAAGWHRVNGAKALTGLSGSYICRLARTGKLRHIRADGWALLLHPDDVAVLASRRGLRAA